MRPVRYRRGIKRFAVSVSSGSSEVIRYEVFSLTWRACRLFVIQIKGDGIDIGIFGNVDVDIAGYSR